MCTLYFISGCHFGFKIKDCTDNRNLCQNITIIHCNQLNVISMIFLIHIQVKVKRTLTKLKTVKPSISYIMLPRRYIFFSNTSAENPIYVHHPAPVIRSNRVAV